MPICDSCHIKIPYTIEIHGVTLCKECYQMIDAFRRDAGDKIEHEKTKTEKEYEFFE